MPKAWLTIPAAREEANSTVNLWREIGYGVALFRDEGAARIEADFVASGPYPGYAIAVNLLCAKVLEIDDHCLFCVAGGDDVEPDVAHTPEEISDELVEHFGGTFGVCQFTGDRFAGGSIDRICGSPWMGREFCRRINQGRGPLWPDYTHMFVDEELQCVSQRYGVLWQRPDLVHLHRHFQRESVALDSKAVLAPTPAHLVEANSPEHWKKYKGIFDHRKLEGFPGSEPL